MMYMIPTLSIGDMLSGLWESFVGFFEMIGSVISMLISLIGNMIEGIFLTIQYVSYALPITFAVIGIMPAMIMAAASVTLLIFILRFVFGAFVG